MMQLSVFNNSYKPKSVIQLYVDGASRNNPGLAGAGIYIVKDNVILVKTGYYLGVKTNNQAEYLALLLGLFLVKKYYKDLDLLEIKSDSLLLVKQILQEYKISNLMLKKINGYIKSILDDINYNICHILRERNQIADKLANQAIDQKMEIPEDIKKIIKEKLDIDI